MSLREKLNEKPWLGFSVAAVVAALAIVFTIVQLLGRSSTSGVSDKAYFTTEDTLTGQAAVDALFVASVSNVPPFDHNGKPAYRASVWVCNSGRTVWVQCLLRYTPKVRGQVVAAYANEAAKGDKTDPDLQPFEGGLEAKAPGEGPWVRAGFPSYEKIVRPDPPPGVPSDDLNVRVP